MAWKYYDEFVTQALKKIRTGKFPDATKDLDRAIELQSDNTHERISCDLANRFSGQYGEAMEILDWATGASQPNVDALLCRGWLYANFGKFQEAIKDFQEVIGLMQGDAFAWTGCALANRFLKKYEQAVVEHNQALEFDGKNARAWFYRAKMNDYSRRYAAAIEDLDMAIQLDPGDVRAWFWRAVMKERLGQDREANSDMENYLVLCRQTPRK